MNLAGPIGTGTTGDCRNNPGQGGSTPSFLEDDFEEDDHER
jgi:hypothetical protein